jgi:PIN domain nuclease of toxin-antitoxin system
VILLDTHIWVWWVHGDSRLSKSSMNFLNWSRRFDIQGFASSV